MVDCLLITPQREVSLISARTDRELEDKIEDLVTPYYGTCNETIFDQHISILSSNLLEGGENRLAESLITRPHYAIRGNAVLIFTNKWTGRLYSIPKEVIAKLRGLNVQESV